MFTNTKIIKRRIKAITNTKKITKAMEMVAASKMRKAVESALGTRTYASMARDLMLHLGLKVPIEQTHPLLQVRPVKKILILIITSNRGLCGGLNANILKKVRFHLDNKKQLLEQRVRLTRQSQVTRTKSDYSEDAEIHALAIGKKGEKFARKNNLKLIAAFDKLSDTPSLNDILPIASIIIKEYEEGNYDKITVVYTDFVSAIQQIPKIRQLLPISERDIEKMLAGIDVTQTDEEHIKLREYIFEPDPVEILSIILPRLVEIQIYQSVLEAAASEHSARMLAMRNASDAARDLIDDLTFTFNQARQAGITRELAEITAGVSALSV
jgi:F-type H+-transporting ATPase subunit gamma